MTKKYGNLQDLARIGVHIKMFHCIADFLSDRTFQVRLGTTLSDVFVQDYGVPQGCILSVTLFILKINSLPQVLPFSPQAPFSMLMSFTFRMHLVTSQSVKDVPVVVKSDGSLGR